MIHRPRFHPPPHIYPPDEWNLIEKRFMPDLLEQGETMFALGNGYLGMRGCFAEGGPIGQNGTFINGFYESWPIVYPEQAYGLAATGQTIVNVTDTKIIKLYVDDEPFWLPHATAPLEVLRARTRMSIAPKYTLPPLAAAVWRMGAPTDVDHSTEPVAGSRA